MSDTNINYNELMSQLFLNVKLLKLIEMFFDVLYYSNSPIM